MKSCCDNPGCSAPYHKIGTSHMYHRKKCRCDSCKEAAALIRNKTADRRRTVVVDHRSGPAQSGALDWQDEAACKGVDINIFFPYDETSTGPRSVSSEASKVFKEEALSYCNRCPVRERCLKMALDSFERGIWGGTDHRERADIRRSLQRNENQPTEEVRAYRAKLVEKAKGTPTEKLMELTTLIANNIDIDG